MTYYVTPNALGTGSGINADNAADYLNGTFWSTVQSSLSSVTSTAQSALSPMPAAFESALPEADFHDLIGYLRAAAAR